MVKLLLTVEGQSEEAFADKVLIPHLVLRGVIPQVRAVRTSRGQRGGYTTYGKLRTDVDQWLREQPDGWHTTLLDLYGLKPDFPGFADATALSAPSRVEHLERAFAADLNHPRFRPYIQQYEFEALLFTAPALMEEWLGLDMPLPVGCFQAIRDQFATPEDINDSPETAPSKRILRLCRGYGKTTDGPSILAEIGLPRLRAACPRFGAWLTWLESLADQP